MLHCRKYWHTYLACNLACKAIKKNNPKNKGSQTMSAKTFMTLLNFRVNLLQHSRNGKTNVLNLQSLNTAVLWRQQATEWKEESILIEKIPGVNLLDLSHMPTRFYSASTVLPQSEVLTIVLLHAAVLPE